MSLGRRIILTLWLFLTLTVTVLGGIFYKLSSDSLEQEARDSTEAQLQTLAILLSRSAENQWERQIKTASLITNCYIEILDQSGTPILDSNPSGRIIVGTDGELAIHSSDLGSVDDLKSGAFLTASRTLGPVRTLRFYRPVTSFQQARLKMKYGLLFTLLAGLTLSAILAYYVSRWLAQPLDRLTNLTDRFSRGELTARTAKTGAPELQELTNRFHDMAEKLALRQQNLESYVADASHELKTPLSSMRSLIDSLKSGALDERERAEEFVDFLAQEVDRLEDLIHRLLALHQIDSGLPESQSVHFDLGELLAEIPTTAKIAIPNSGPKVSGDPVLIRQVVTNLLENAECATRNSPEPKIELTLDEHGTITVADNGKGLEPEQASKVFDRFYQADPSREGKGSGLGLAICKGIVEAHGGKLTVRSKPGGGSSFSFTLKTV